MPPVAAAIPAIAGIAKAVAPIVGVAAPIVGGYLMLREQRRAAQRAERMMREALAGMPTPTEARMIDPVLMEELGRRIVEDVRAAYALRGLAEAGIAAGAEAEALRQFRLGLMERAFERGITAAQLRAQQLRALADIYAQQAAGIGAGMQQMVQNLMWYWLLRRMAGPVVTPTPFPTPLPRPFPGDIGPYV